MLQINVNKRSIDRLEELSNLIDAVPAKIKMANSRAATMSVKDIKDNLARRGRPGEVIDVSYDQYGDFGLRFKLTPRPGRGGYNGGRSQTGRYSILIASRIFLSSEEGKVGRRAFTLRRRTSADAVSKGKRQGSWRYEISHSSGKWQKGQRLVGPLKIPAIGPFHFSGQSGMPRQKISAFSRNTIRKYLNRYYENLLKRNSQ